MLCWAALAAGSAEGSDALLSIVGLLGVLRRFPERSAHFTWPDPIVAVTVQELGELVSMDLAQWVPIAALSHSESTARTRAVRCLDALELSGPFLRRLLMDLARDGRSDSEREAAAAALENMAPGPRARVTHFDRPFLESI